MNCLPAAGAFDLHIKLQAGHWADVMRQRLPLSLELAEDKYKELVCVLGARKRRQNKQR